MSRKLFARGQLNCREVSASSALGPLSPAWDGLVEQSAFNDIFASCAFAKVWWDTYGGSNRLRVILVEDASAAVRLIAPFYEESLSPGTLKAIGNFRGDYSNVFANKNDDTSIEQMFSWLRRQRNWRTLVLNNLPEGSPVLGYFKHSANHANRRLLGQWFKFRQPLAIIRFKRQHPVIDKDALLAQAQLLSSANYQRQLKWFRKHGELVYRCERNTVAIAGLLPQFFELHIRNREAKAERSLFLDARNRRFYQMLTNALSQHGAVRLDTLAFNGRVIAAHFGFDWDGRVYYYKPCYEPAYSARSPGKLLLAHMIQDAAHDGKSEFDLLKGNEAYKTIYASGVRTTASVKVYRSRLDAILSKIATTLRG